MREHEEACSLFGIGIWRLSGMRIHTHWSYLKSGGTRFQKEYCTGRGWSRAKTCLPSQCNYFLASNLISNTSIITCRLIPTLPACQLGLSSHSPLKPSHKSPSPPFPPPSTTNPHSHAPPAPQYRPLISSSPPCRFLTPHYAFSWLRPR